MLNTHQKIQDCDLLKYLQKKQSLIINARQKNGIIIYKSYHAEFAGPGAIVGGSIDSDLIKILSVGDLSVVFPQTAKERIAAYLIRRQWNRLIKQVTDETNSLERAQLILNQFKHWFDAQTVEQIPDEAFGLLVGVFPQTIRSVRESQYGF